MIQAQNQPTFSTKTAFQTVTTATTIAVAIAAFCIGAFVIIDLQTGNWIDNPTWQSPKIYSSIFDLTIGTLVPGGVILRNESIKCYIRRNNKKISQICDKFKWRKCRIQPLPTIACPDLNH